jgi:hypothetical protein
MRIVVWTDKDGWKHRSLIRDSDPDTAAQSGILQDPPDIREVDWEGVARELHNFFVDHGVVTWSDLQKCRCLRAGLISAAKWRVITRFRSMEPEVDNG